ncbi:protein ALP1-like [Rutidosis leptorrhynchoides]|uniref:protein ALP1-like n=1 Tax=Rutidosis leptorrhynchoides TaxID=125765 RepID=UPI003A992940
MALQLVKSRFQHIGGLPNCCGAVETTHLKMNPSEDETEPRLWFDRARYYSMTLQAIVDPMMRFVDLLIGMTGSMANDDVLQESEFFKLAQKGEKFYANVIEFSDGTKVGEYIIGGSSFQLLSWLITPFQDAETRDQTKFNRKHFETRWAAEQALTKLKDDWAAIDGSMWQPDRHKLPLIAVACCILHNIKIEIEGDGNSCVSDKFDHDPKYPQEMSGLVDKEAAVVRDKISFYLADKLED